MGMRTHAMLQAFALMFAGMGDVSYNTPKPTTNLPPDEARLRSELENCHIFLKRLQVYNEEKGSHKKAKEFEIQGFTIMAFSEAKARQKLRQLLGHTYLHPDLTEQQIADKLESVKPENK